MLLRAWGATRPVWLCWAAPMNGCATKPPVCDWTSGSGREGAPPLPGNWLGARFCCCCCCWSSDDDDCNVGWPFATSRDCGHSIKGAVAVVAVVIIIAWRPDDDDDDDEDDDDGGGGDVVIERSLAKRANWRSRNCCEYEEEPFCVLAAGRRASELLLQVPACSCCCLAGGQFAWRDGGRGHSPLPAVELALASARCSRNGDCRPCCACPLESAAA